MKLPKIDLASLPDLNQMVGMFGAARQGGPSSDDSIIVLMSVVYETNPPGSGII